jgi:hypothetical protein
VPKARRFRMQLKYVMCDDWWIMAIDETLWAMLFEREPSFFN